MEVKHNGMKNEEELKFVQYMECIEAVCKIVRVLRCAGGRWSTMDKVNCFSTKKSNG